MTDYGKHAEQHIAERLDRIESVLATLHVLMEQERANPHPADWSTAGELGYIASRLEEIEDFWSQEGEEYSE
jgi:hypothetical protein